MVTATKTTPPTSTASGTKPEKDHVIADLAQSYNQGGAMGMLDRVGSMMEKRFDDLYSSANMNSFVDKFMDALPEELREGLSQLFNMLSGAGDEKADLTQNREYKLSDALYGVGASDDVGVKYDDAISQRDEGSYASIVTKGSGGGGANRTVNGITYGPDGKPVNDANEEVDELSSQMEEISNSLSEVDGNGILKDWDKRSFEFGDTEISSEGWDNIMDIMKDPKKKKAAFDKIAKENNWTPEERDKAEKDVDEAADIMGRVKHGKATPEDLARLKVIGAENPNAVIAAKKMSERGFDRGLKADATPSVSSTPMNKAQAENMFAVEVTDAKADNPYVKIKSEGLNIAASGVTTREKPTEEFNEAAAMRSGPSSNVIATLDTKTLPKSAPSLTGGADFG